MHLSNWPGTQLQWTKIPFSLSNGHATTCGPLCPLVRTANRKKADPVEQLEMFLCNPRRNKNETEKIHHGEGKNMLSNHITDNTTTTGWVAPLEATPCHPSQSHKKKPSIPARSASFSADR